MENQFDRNITPRLVGDDTFPEYWDLICRVSIHWFTFLRLSEVRLLRQQIQEGNPGVPLPSGTLQRFLGDPEVFTGQMGYIIPPQGRRPNQIKPPQLACGCTSSWPLLSGWAQSPSEGNSFFPFAVQVIQYLFSHIISPLLLTVCHKTNKEKKGIPDSLLPLLLLRRWWLPVSLKNSSSDLKRLLLSWFGFLFASSSSALLPRSDHPVFSLEFSDCFSAASFVSVHLKLPVFIFSSSEVLHLHYFHTNSCTTQMILLVLQLQNNQQLSVRSLITSLNNLLCCVHWTSHTWFYVHF